MKWIEDIGKDLLNHSRVAKLIHYLQNRKNKDAVFIWIPKNAGTSIYKTLKKHGCLKAKKRVEEFYFEDFEFFGYNMEPDQILAQQ